MQGVVVNDESMMTLINKEVHDTLVKRMDRAIHAERESERCRKLIIFKFSYHRSHSTLQKVCMRCGSQFISQLSTREKKLWNENELFDYENVYENELFDLTFSDFILIEVFLYDYFSFP